MKEMLMRFMGFMTISLMTTTGLYADAQTFEAEGIYYKVMTLPVADGANEVMVTVPDINAEEYVQLPLDESGCCTIPATVNFDGIEYSVTTLYGAIRGQALMKHLLLPSTMKQIRQLSLMDCPNLETINFGGVNTIWYSTICNLPKLNTMIFQEDDPIVCAGEGVFGSIGLTHWTCPENFSSANHIAFNNWSDVTYLDLSNGYVCGGCHSWNNMIKVETIILGRFDAIEDSYNGTVSLKKLTLPASSCEESEISDSFNNLGSLREIFSPSPTPITVKYNSELGTIGNGTIDPETCKLYIPIGAKDAYLAHDSWKTFQNIFEIDFANIENVKAETSYDIAIENGSVVSLSGQPIEVYNLNGERVENKNVAYGIYVVKTSNSKSVKILVK